MTAAWIQNSNAAAGGGGGTLSLYSVIQNTVGTTNLVMCLDAGDSASYASGQQWSDLSGNNVNLWRGATSASTTDDPTFNGVAGALTSSEYWSFDGGDIFNSISSNPIGITSIHKDNANLTILYILNVVSFSTPSAGAFGICGNHNTSSGDVGFFISGKCGGSSDDGKMDFAVGPSVTTLYKLSSTVKLTTGWNIAALSFDEAAAAGFWWRHKVIEAISGSYSSPTVADPAAGIALANIKATIAGSDNYPMDSNQYLAGFAIFNTALPKIALDSIYDGIKSRYSLS